MELNRTDRKIRKKSDVNTAETSLILIYSLSLPSPTYTPTCLDTAESTCAMWGFVTILASNSDSVNGSTDMLLTAYYTVFALR